MYSLVVVWVDIYINWWLPLNRNLWRSRYTEAQCPRPILWFVDGLLGVISQGRRGEAVF